MNQDTFQDTRKYMLDGYGTRMSPDPFLRVILTVALTALSNVCMAGFLV